MNLDEYNYIRDLAYKCPISLATANARSILYLVSGEEVSECITMGTRNARQLIKEVEFASAGNQAYIEDNYPDPFTDKTYIDYYVPEGSSGSIFINDMYGRKLAEYKAMEGENILTVEKGNLAPGIYTYGLIVDGQIIEFKKLVIKQ